MSYEKKQLQTIIEGAILAAGEPLTLDRMLTMFEEHEAPSKEDLNEVLEELKRSCDDRGFVLTEVASGFRFQVREDLAEWVNRLWDEKPQKYSRAMLETLALIAYRQPITRGDIEEVRGVAVSSHIVKTLVERDWVKVVGHRDVPGRPALYATTRQFLDYFNLKSLEELPTLGELRDIDSLNEALEFDSLPPEVQESITAAAAVAEAESAVAQDQNETADPVEGEESLEVESETQQVAEDEEIDEIAEDVGSVQGDGDSAEEPEPRETEQVQSLGASDQEPAGEPQDDTPDDVQGDSHQERPEEQEQEQQVALDKDPYESLFGDSSEADSNEQNSDQPKPKSENIEADKDQFHD